MKLSDISFEQYVNAEDRMRMVYDVIGVAIVDELIDRFKTGELSTPEWNKDYECRLFFVIDKIINPGPRNDAEMWRQELQMEVKHYSISGFYALNSMIETGKMDEAREAFNQLIKSPSIRSSFFECFKKEARIGLAIDDWNMKFKLFNPDTREILDFNPAEKPSPDIYEIEIDFPTGNLLMMNCITGIDKIEELLDVRDKVWRINNEEGNVEFTKACLPAGIIDIHIGDGQADIMKVGDKIVIGGYDVDGDIEVDTYGSLNGAVWRGNIVDESTMLEFLRNGDPSLTMDGMYQFFEDNEVDIEKIYVDPGIHHVYFTFEDDNFRFFKKDARERSIVIPEAVEQGIEPKIIISKEKMTFENRVVQSLSEQKPINHLKL